MSKDQDAVEILEKTNELLKETSSEELRSLEEEQTQRLEELAVENMNEVLDMEKELKNAEDASVAHIEKQMEHQKEKVNLSVENSWRDVY